MYIWETRKLSTLRKFISRRKIICEISNVHGFRPIKTRNIGYVDFGVTLSLITEQMISFVFHLTDLFVQMTQYQQ